MATPAQIAANQRNAQRSTGPKTPETRAIAARNSLKHGMSGDGRALPQSDLAAVERLTAALLDELAPKTERGKSLVRQMALLTARLEKIGLHSIAAADSRERNAASKFDEDREDKAHELFEAMSEDPRMHLRKLMRMPEGVEELLFGWTTLRSQLTRAYRPAWTPQGLERAARLQGLRPDELEDCNLAELSERFWAETDPKRRAEIRDQLAEAIDYQILELEEHFEALDHARLAKDRDDAGLVASLGSPKEMELLRRYESEASRRYARCLKELQEAEGPAKGEARPKASPPPAPPRPAPARELASFGESDPLARSQELLARIRLGQGPESVGDPGVQAPKTAPEPAQSAS